MNYMPVSEKYFFPSPGEGVIFIGFIKGSVGHGFHHFFCEEGNPVFPDFRKGRRRRFPVVGAAVLAAVAAENKGSFSDDGLLFFGEVFFFLGEIGFAVPGVEGLFPYDFPRAGPFTKAAVSAGKGEGGIGGKGKSGENGADGDIGTVHRMDEAVVSSEEAQPCGVGQPPVHHGGRVGERFETGLGKGFCCHLYDAVHVPVIDPVIVFASGVEGNVSHFPFFRFIGK